jgi:hypothetical protein
MVFSALVGSTVAAVRRGTSRRSITCQGELTCTDISISSFILDNMFVTECILGMGHYNRQCYCEVTGDQYGGRTRLPVSSHTPNLNTPQTTAIGDTNRFITNTKNQKGSAVGKAEVQRRS